MESQRTDTEIKYYTERKVEIKNLPWEEKATIMWGWCWRGLIISGIAFVISMVVGYAVGIIFGIILVVFKIELESNSIVYKILGGGVGFVIGFIGLYYLLNWITKVKIGNYKLVILSVSTSNQNNSTNAG